MSDNKMTTCPFTGMPLKVTLVGDGCVGKSCLFSAHTNGLFPTEYPDPEFNNINHDEKVDGVTYCLTIWDTPGQEVYERLRHLHYFNTSVFIVCFSLNSRDSFKNISQTWLPELRANNPKVPMLLVGTKKDVRDESMISPKDGRHLCKKEGFVKYLECSAKTQEGLAKVFQAAALASTGLLKKK